MSELLQRWLNNEIGLSRTVQVFERDFSNGYLFGELLHKHGLLEDFADTFVDENRLVAKRANLHELKAALNSGTASSLGIRLKVEQIAQIMDEDRGCSLRLLFQLRKGLKEMLGQTRQPAHRKDATERIEKKPRGEHEERFFDAGVKSLQRTEPRVVHELQVKDFYDEHTRQMSKAAAGERAERDRTLQRQKDFMTSRHATMADHKIRVADMDHANSESHQKTIRRQMGNVDKDLQFEKFTIKREMQKHDRSRNLHKQDCGYFENEENYGIGWFEKNLQRIGIDTSEHAGASEATIQADNAKELYDKMHEKFGPAASDLKKECTLRMKKIKETKKASDQAQKERERRRRRVQMKQEEEQVADEERKQQEALLLESEAYKGAVEYEEQEKFYSEANQKAALLIQRRARGFITRKTLRRRKRKAINQVSVEKANTALLEMTDRVNAERTQKLELKKADQTQRREEPSSDEDEDLGATQKSEKMPLDRSMEASPEPAEEMSTVAPAGLLVEHVKDPRVSEYLFGRGEWGRCTKALPQESRALKPQLGGLVRWLLAPGMGSADSAKLPTDYLPIIAISGSPTRLGSLGAGQVVAQKICAELGYALVDPRKVVDECLALARKEEQEPEWPMLGRLYQLGKSLLEEQTALGPEAVVPQTTLVEMIFRKIELLASPPPKQEEEEEPAPDPKKKPKKPPAKKEEEKKEPVRPAGIVILGYLCDFAQQSVWESMLRGYMTPLLRVNDGEADMQAQLSSIIAPFIADEVHAEDCAAMPILAEEPPLRLMRLRYESHTELCGKVVAEATNDKAWQPGDQAPASDTPAPPPSGGPGAKGKGGRGSPAAVEPEAAEVVPTMLSAGYDQEYFALSNPVDRAWLYEESQALVRLFAAPLASIRDVIPEPQVSEEATESIENALSRQALALTCQWHHLSTVELEDDPPAEEEAAPAAPDAEPAAVAGDDKEQKLMPQVAGAPWHALSQDEREQMKLTWLESLSRYLTSLHAAMDQLHEKTNGFGSLLVKMQRNFLEFLQRNDEKSHVLGDFLQSWPQRAHGRHHDAVMEEIEELSDRLWQFADRRRAEAVEEHIRLMDSGFWEEQARTSLQLAAELYGVEYSKFQSAAAMLAQAHGKTAEEPPALTDIHDFSLEQLSTLQELGEWLQGLTASVAEAPLPLQCEPPADAPVTETSAEVVPETMMPDEDMASLAELNSAVSVEKGILLRRLRTVEAWVLTRLALMREQLDEAFRRMDDWIRDRVRVENDSIKAAIAQLQGSGWEPGASDELMSPSAGRGSSRSGSKMASSLKASQKKMMPSPTGGPVRRRRREVLKALEARTLDAEVLVPEKLQVESGDSTGQSPSSQDGLQLTRRPSGLGGSASTSEGRWSQDMLSGLLQQLMVRTGGTATCSPDDLLAVFLERRLSGYSFDIDLVPPAWVRRSEASLAAFCLGLVSTHWGVVAVDITEFLLTLTLHERSLPWPTQEALLASRQFLESSAGGLSPEQLEAYPDVPISEELFSQLPLWDEKVLAKLSDEAQNERPEALKHWIFAVLSCFEDEAAPQLPTPATVGTASPTTGGMISVRRLFTYFGMGATPMAGLQLAFQLLLSPHQSTEEAGEEVEGCQQIFVHHLRKVLFSTGGARPRGAAASAPDLEDFVNELTKAPEGVEADPTEVDPAEEPPAPETITIPFEEKALLRKPAVLRALCTHGGLLCRKRSPDMLFPTGGAHGLALHNSAESAVAKGLVSMVPTPPPTQETSPPFGSEGAL